ncbi:MULTISPECIES: DUF3526 domain-containing protein [Methylomonas]|uniref:DUF3526 domain-containing protein n=1 Tax=Methylomonas TaxID=416 RepID=UPI0007C9541D|nr:MULTISPECIES: DUF3526 domain-containing protein [Methylomonas]ANE55536.1 ABC transporter permease [Methylomonas sp. DH-1]WNB77965.1 DUF3526 domain-containing protein [Methylomonas koyamae]
MMNIVKVEWIRIRRNPLNGVILLIFAVLLGLSAIWSGFRASEIRAAAAAPQIAQAPANAAEMHDAPKPDDHDGGDDSAYAASNKLPPLQLPLLGGLALNVSQADLVGTSIKVSSRSRHTDGRNSDQIFNPLSYEFGLLDFASVFALLTPLVVIALSYGLVQEERESGVWRLVCTQTARPWQLVFSSLGLRLLLVALIASLSSALAFLLDSGSDWPALAYWAAISLSYVVFWFALTGLFLLLPISSGAAAIGLLGSWLVLTFGVPAALHWAADQSQPKPSRMAAIIEIRRLQEASNQQRQTALADWFKAHPDLLGDTPLAKLPREVAGLPAAMQLDHQIRPLMMQFETHRAERFGFMQRWCWTSPALALALAADRLSGLDAPRHAGFVAAVDAFEDRWREYFLPQIMARAGWSEAQQAALPRFDFRQTMDYAELNRLAGWQALSAASILAFLIALRQRFARF